jgi:hypothetical protein
MSTLAESLPGPITAIDSTINATMGELEVQFPGVALAFNDQHTLVGYQLNHMTVWSPIASPWHICPTMTTGAIVLQPTPMTPKVEIPEPGTIVLFGIACLLVGVMSKTFKSSAAKCREVAK